MGKNVYTAFTRGLTLAVGIAAGVIGARVLNAQPQPVTRTVLLTTELAGIEGKEARMLRSEVAPGAATEKHYHPGHEFFYVLEGSGTLEAEGQPPLPLKPGVASYDPPKLVHVVKNTSKTAPLKLVVFLVAEKGQPLTVTVE